ncbi:MAG: LysM peptidoglycan-binding domain-containing protein [Pirellulales bacterium]|nr:LysM peptidoglycan-binding domain-containing protein [Pirellulales bacterium]
MNKKVGKPVKIGAAIVFIVLIVVGIFVAVQFRSSAATTEDVAAAMEPPAPPAEGKRSHRKHHRELRESKKPVTPPVSPPTVVPPIAVAAKPPAEPPGGEKTPPAAPVHNPPPPGPAAPAASQPPNLMPNPLKSEGHFARQEGNPPPPPPLPPEIAQRPAGPPPGTAANNGPGPSGQWTVMPPIEQAPNPRYAPPPDLHDYNRYMQNDPPRPRADREQWAEHLQSNPPRYRHLPHASPAKGAGTRGDGTYEVQPLDSYWTISETLYGTGAYFKALAEHNRGKVEGEEPPKIGEILSTPSIEELQKKYPDLCPKPRHHDVLVRQAIPVGTGPRRHGGRKYTVVEGDTLFDIARYELGKAARWVEIYEMNREALGRDFDYLVPGTELLLPGEPSARPDPLTRRHGPGYR